MNDQRQRDEEPNHADPCHGIEADAGAQGEPDGGVATDDERRGRAAETRALAIAGRPTVGAASAALDGIASECPVPGTVSSVVSASGTRTASPWPPSPFIGKNPPFMQAVVTPSWQLGQLPSLNANGAITRSPFLTEPIAAPTSSMTPMNSWPIGPGANGESPR
jgi:hypothetical protein